jgi:hypothetical protein
MKKIAFVFMLLSFMACKPESSYNCNINGIWIPQMINWEDGSFNTFYFYNDTSFIMLSSTQKQIKDSIFFQVEPGFVLKQGTFISLNSIKAEIKSHVLYRFITLPGDTTPSTLLKESLTLVKEGKNIVSFEYNGSKYIRTSKYTSQSANTIKNLATKMAPDLKKEYGIN